MEEGIAAYEFMKILQMIFPHKGECNFEVNWLGFIKGAAGSLRSGLPPQIFII
jgi:hypothetical protein